MSRGLNIILSLNKFTLSGGNVAYKPIYVADIETTGLLHDLKEQGENAKLHNLAIKNVLNPDEEIRVFHANTESERNELQEFLNNEMYFYMHNGIMYDSVAFEMLGFDVSKITFVDSYALSLYLYLERDRHGLESWGEEFDVPKPVIKDWNNLTQADYDNRVVEDVKINYELYLKQKKDFCEIYGEMTDKEYCNHKTVRYLGLKFEQLREQEKCKIEIDVDLCEETISKYTKMVEEKTESLKKVMPKTLVKKKQKRPAKPFLKNGELSATGLKWKEITETAGVDFDFPHEIEVIVGTKEANPNSSQQIKDWLFSLGWKPDVFKYVKESNGDSRAIAQVYIPSSGGELTQSVLNLAQKESELNELTGKSVIAHRLGVLKGFLSSLEDGNCVTAGASGFTNTLRLKHKKPMVNLPAYNKPYSSSIRSCIKARKGKIFYGADLSGLETILKLNYQMPYDPEFVKEQQSDDFDPHLVIAVEAGIITQAESDYYKIKDKGFPLENYEQTDELKKLMLLVPSEEKTKLVEISGFRHIGKQGNYSCLPMDTTVLTPTGFKKFNELSIGDTVISFKDGMLVEDKILHKHFFKNASLWHYGDSKKVLKATKDHRWLTTNRSGKELVYKNFEEFTKETKILTTAPYNGGSLEITDDEASLIGWILSDGSFLDYKVSISQSLNKFYKEIESLLGRLGLSYKTHQSCRENGNHVNIYRLSKAEIRNLFEKIECGLDKEKFNWSEWVLKLPKTALESFLNAFFLGDGNFLDKRSYVITQKSGVVADAVLLAMYLIGDGRVKEEYRDNDMKVLRKHKTNFISTQRKSVKKKTMEDVFCLTTGNSNFVIKQDDEIMITGNCQYGAGAKAVSRSASIPLETATKVVTAYREKNWSINAIANDQYVVKHSTGKWLLNPINGMYYFIKNDKDIFSTLVQGSGSFILDLWLSFCFKLRKERNIDFDLLATFHDEKIFELDDNEETKQAVKKLSDDALIMVNNLLKLEIPIKSSFDFGYRYSDIH
jgi:hypothetical protein